MDLWLALNKEGSKVSGWASQFKQLIDNMASGESGGGHDVSLEAYTQCMREAVRGMCIPMCIRHLQLCRLFEQSGIGKSARA